MSEQKMMALCPCGHVVEATTTKATEAALIHTISQHISAHEPCSELKREGQWIVVGPSGKRIEVPYHDG